MEFNLSITSKTSTTGLSILEHPASSIQHPVSSIHHPSSTIHHLLSNKGYTLYLVLVVLVVSGILFSISLRNSLAAHIFSVRHVQTLQAKLLASSGIKRAEFFLNGGDGHDLYWETDNFEEKIEDYGLITIACSRFGVFAKVKSTGRRLKKEYAIDGLLGRDIPEILNPVLTLTGHVGGLVFEKNTSVRGSVVIHHGEVTRGKRRDRIPGSEKWTIIRESPLLPFDIEIVKNTLTALNDKLLAAGSSPDAVKGDCIINSISDSIKAKGLVCVDGDCRIGTGRIEDIVIVASGSIIVENGAECFDVVCIAKKVLVSGGITGGCLFFTQGKLCIEGGMHNSQFLALDSIIAGKDARFPKGNAWICYRKLTSDTTVTGGVYFDKNEGVFGNVVCFSDTTQNGSVPYAGASVVLAENSAFSGCIITDGDVDINNVTIKGQLWARSLITNDGDILYKNWLINCTVVPSEGEVVFPLLGKPPARVSLFDTD